MCVLWYWCSCVDWFLAFEQGHCLFCACLLTNVRAARLVKPMCFHWLIFYSSYWLTRMVWHFRINHMVRLLFHQKHSLWLTLDLGNVHLGATLFATDVASELLINSHLLLSVLLRYGWALWNVWLVSGDDSCTRRQFWCSSCLLKLHQWKVESFWTDFRLHCALDLSDCNRLALWIVNVLLSCLCSWSKRDSVAYC